MVESPAPSERQRGHAHSLSIDQLPPDIFHSESKALLGPLESTPADNLKRLVQECGVSPHKISELLHELPPRQMTDKLIDFYFTHMYERLGFSVILFLILLFSATGLDILSPNVTFE